MATQDLLKKVRRLEIRSRRLVEDLFSGGTESVFKGRGVEFEEVRPYVPGDEVRDIDWNVTARLGHPYVKRFVDLYTNRGEVVEGMPKRGLGDMLREFAEGGR